MTNKAPNSIPWPPLIYLSAAALGFGISQWIELPYVDTASARGIGTGLMVAAITIDVWTAIWFRKHRTTILPHRAATNLITTGPFSRSRNPIYLANTMLLAGVGFAFNFPGMIALALPAAILTQKLAIEPEERHLAETFGTAWAAYAAKTPRWLLF